MMEGEPDPLFAKTVDQAPDVAFPFTVNAPTTLRVEQRRISADTDGNTEIYNDFMIRDSADVKVPYTDFEAGADPWSVGFYQCHANYWIAGIDVECVDP